MKTQAQILKSEMHALIENSCAVNPNTKNESYSFQRALLKFYFGAADVIINYDKERITLFTSKRKRLRRIMISINPRPLH